MQVDDDCIVMTCVCECVCLFVVYFYPFVCVFLGAMMARFALCGTRARDIILWTV